MQQALNKMSAQDIYSPYDLPKFHNSAMDGFLLRAIDTQSASVDKPIILPVVANIEAGDLLQHNYKINTAIRINTGAAIPKFFDAVVKSEDVEVINPIGANDSIKIISPIDKYQHIRLIGTDFRQGDLLLPKSTRISPQHIMGLAAIGCKSIDTFCLPKLHIISTGKEVIANCSKLSENKIYDANAPYLSAFANLLKIDCMLHGNVGDHAQKYINLLEEILATTSGPNIIVSTGAVSKGSKDFIPFAMQRLNASILFHKVKVKPGKPILFAKLNEDNYFFGLPGNPVSTAVGMRFFIYPLLRKLQGLSPEIHLKAKLTSNIEKNSSFTYFYRGVVSVNNNEVLVRSLPEQESYKINSLMQANCWIKLDSHMQSLHPGEMVAVFPADLH